MEDIEDLLVGSGGGGGAPPGFRLPLAAVGINPKQKNNKPHLKNNPLIQDLRTSQSSKIPGTQTIYMKTFGCSHNQSDSEYMAGQLSAFGYALSDNPEEADIWLINTCQLDVCHGVHLADTSYAVSEVSWNMTNIGKEDWQEVKQLSRYFKSTLDVGLIY